MYDDRSVCYSRTKPGSFRLRRRAAQSHRPKDLDFSTPLTVKEIFETHLPDSGKPAITIYFHGGVVSSTTEFGAPGFPYRPSNQGLLDNLSHKSYPIFVVWESGLKETLQSIGLEFKGDPFQRLLELAQETSKSELFKKAMAHLANMLSKKAATLFGLGLAGEEGAPPLPVAPIEENLDRVREFEPVVVEYEELTEEDQQEFMAQLALDDDLNQRLREIAEEAQSGAGLAGDDRSSIDYVDNELIQDINEDYDSAAAGLLGSEILFPLVYKKLGQVLLAVAKRFANKRHHDFVPTIFEELARVFYLEKFAALLWKQMKTNAARAYEVNAPDDQEPHGGTYLIEQLKAYLLAHPGTEVNLVGHSAGSIQISHFVEAADELFQQELPEFKFKNIILLAPGADFETFAKIRTRPKRFQNLRIFTMGEKLEKSDHMIPAVYPHSILYFVSGVTDRDDSGDRPILGLARHLDRQLFQRLGIHDPQVEAAHDFLDELAKQSGFAPIVWTTSVENDPPGRRSSADQHGKFDNDPLTLESVQSYL
jgi:hypothetical protein